MSEFLILLKFDSGRAFTTETMTKCRKGQHIPLYVINIFVFINECNLENLVSPYFEQTLAATCNQRT